MPVLICQREKLWTRTYSIGDQVPTCPVFTCAKIKSRFGIFSQYMVFLMQNIYNSPKPIADRQVQIWTFRFSVESESKKNARKKDRKIKNKYAGVINILRFTLINTKKYSILGAFLKKCRVSSNHLPEVYIGRKYDFQFYYIKILLFPLQYIIQKYTITSSNPWSS